MRAKQFYDNIQGLSFECSCVGIGQREWDKLMRGHKRANKHKVEGLIKKHIPDLFKDLSLEFYNPYDSYRTKTHLIYVHSLIEYFLKIKS